jgi:cytidine deaminase
MASRYRLVGAWLVSSAYAAVMNPNDDPTVQRLLEAARQAKGRAYAPYSNYPVGAAVITDLGTVYAGCNVENAAYPQGWCAEASALAAMASAGERRIEVVVVVSDGELLGTPCGGCRQKIREFAGPSTMTHVAGHDGIRRSYTIDELLPDSFGPEHLA